MRMNELLNNDADFDDDIDGLEEFMKLNPDYNPQDKPEDNMVRFDEDKSDDKQQYVTISKIIVPLEFDYV